MASSTEASGDAGRSGSIGLGCCVFLFGVIFSFYGFSGVLRALNRAGWQETPCSIGTFEIRTDGPGDRPFFAEVSYRYEWAGVTHTGSRLWPDDPVIRDYTRWWDTKQAITGGSHERPVATRCWVNPENPEEACLQRTCREMLLAQPAAAGFAAFAIVAGISLLFGGSQIIPRVTLAAAFAVGMVFMGLALRAVWQSFRQSGWVEVPVQIVRESSYRTYSRHRSHDHPLLLYSYRFHGESYLSSRTNLQHVWGDWRKALRGQSGRGHPLAYVNPARPSQAVLFRYSNGFVGWFLFGTIFCGFAGLGFYALRRAQMRHGSPDARPLPPRGAYRQGKTRRKAKRWK